MCKDCMGNLHYCIFQSDMLISNMAQIHAPKHDLAKTAVYVD